MVPPRSHAPLPLLVILVLGAALPAAAAGQGVGDDSPVTAATSEPVALPSRAEGMVLEGRPRLGADGRVRLKATVAAAGHVQARATPAGRERHTTLARGARTARHGGRITVTLRLTRAARRALARDGRLRARLRAVYTDAAGERRVRTVTATLRRPA